MLNIGDISTCERLAHAQMAKVKGGLDPFAHLGLTSMMHSIPGYQTETAKPDPNDMVVSIPRGETIYVEDTNHTEITTQYPG